MESLFSNYFSDHLSISTGSELDEEVTFAIQKGDLCAFSGDMQYDVRYTESFNFVHQCIFYLIKIYSNLFRIQNWK